MTDPTISEHHFRTVPGSMFGASATTLKMQFAQAQIPEGYTGILELAPHGTEEPASTPLSPGKSCLSVTVENLKLEINPADVRKLQDKLNIPQKSAQHLMVVHSCDELAKSIARHFFHSASEIDPTLRVRPVLGNDGSVGAQNLQIVMTGRANKHPFWSPNGTGF